MTTTSTKEIINKRNSQTPYIKQSYCNFFYLREINKKEKENYQTIQKSIQTLKQKTEKKEFIR